MNARTCEDLGLSQAVSPQNTDVMAATPTLATDFVRPLPAVARALGFDLERQLEDLRLPRDLFEASGLRISYMDLAKVLQACEQATGSDHVGLLVGREVRLSDLGAAAGAALTAGTAGDGLRHFVEHCNLHDTPVTASLEVHGGWARFSCKVIEHGIADPRQFDYLGTAITCNVLQEMCGRLWQASAIRCASRGPAEPAAFEAALGAPLEFGVGTSEVEFAAHWLEQPLPPLKPATRAAIAVELQQARFEALTDLPGTLRRVLRKRLLVSDFSMDDVAAQLAMHRRTLDRRLQRFDTTYGELLESVRDDIARQLLRETTFSIQRIAESVRFSSAANFATAFRRRAGMTPTEYRRQAH